MTNPETVRILGWCLLHFVWQGAVLALVLCALLARLRSPQARYASAVCALTVMMIAPFATFALLQQSPPSIHDVSVGENAQIRSGFEAVQAMVAAPDVRPSSTAAKAASIDWMSYAVLAWLAGVYMFTLRTLGAWMLLIRMRRQRAESIAGDLLQTCLALQRRLGVSRAVRFVCSKAAESPAVLGWWRPVVVLPLSALAGLSPWQVEAIIAHELAHIKRWDGLVNLFQIATETLLFYHPAVWWVNRVIRNEREHCCDDVAVSACGNAPGYARALALLEESRSSSVWAMAANGGVLTSRIGRLLGIKGTARTISTSGLVFIGSLCVAGHSDGGVRQHTSHERSAAADAAGSACSASGSSCGAHRARRAGCARGSRCAGCARGSISSGDTLGSSCSSESNLAAGPGCGAKGAPCAQGAGYTEGALCAHCRLGRGRLLHWRAAIRGPEGSDRR